MPSQSDARGGRLILAAVSALFAVLAAEVVLRVASAYVPAIDLRTRRPGFEYVPDSILVWRGRPGYPGRDARGYRNPTALDHADIVVLGDSQTEGASVPQSDIWSSVAGDNLGVTAYNMGIGGWSATQAAFVFRDALALDPEVIAYALYFGNDFLEDYDRARTLGLLDAVIDVDALARVTVPEPDPAPGGPPARGLRPWLSRHSRVWGVLRHARRTLWAPDLRHDFEAAKEVAERDPRDDETVFEGPEWRTVLTVPYRWSALDDSDPGVRAGVEVSKAMMLAMAAEAREAGVTYVVVVIPTKESVFAPRIRHPRQHPGLDRLVAAEARLRADITEFLLAADIPPIDVLKPLIDAEHQPYPVGRDGHPNHWGHRVIGGTIAAALRSLSPSRD